MEILFGISIGVMLTMFIIGWSLKRDSHPYSYHVAYQSKSESGEMGFGSMIVKRSQKVTTTEDIKNVREFIEKENPKTCKSVVILNWIQLK